ncbi:MAG: CapA family protein [Demequinaceae bacterium]|nr:CapA family protein [Demequinaceae bacterium]
MARPAPDDERDSRRSLPLAVRVALETVGVAVVAVSIGFAAHAAFSDPPAPPEPSPSPSPSPVVTPVITPSPEPEGPVSFTLIAGGDVIAHESVVNSATSGGTIDFGPLWENLDPWISGADLAFCNMETPVAPAGTEPSGYPKFGAPRELVASLDEAGWDGCSTASNHAVDRGWAGIVTTLDAFDDVRLGAVGTARTAEEAASAQYYRVREGKRTITVAHIAYSYGTNGIPKPSGKPWSVNTLDMNAVDASPVLNAAQAARDAGADVVIASIHCCSEYVTAPTKAQASLAKKIADSGLVDLYIGHHAHVPQPITLLSGGPNGDGMWVAYGLGNYISNQDTAFGLPAATTNGVLLTATFTVEVDGTVETGVEWSAVTVDRRNRHTMYVLSEIPNGAGTLSSAEVAARHERVENAVGSAAPERLLPPGPLADNAYWIRRKPWEPEQ